MDIYLAKKIEDSVIEGSLADGAGLRCTIFTCGCPHHCVECQNAWTWDIKRGVETPVGELADYIVKIFENSEYDGITLSGGDPLYQPEAVFELLTILKKRIPDLNVWCYTGYLYDEVKSLKALKLIDVLVDGQFEKNKKFPKKKFRGSWNQRILYLSDGLIKSEE